MSFWQAKTKIDAADRLFSLYIRKRDRNKCQYCGSNPADGRGMQNSHFFGRRMESVRYDPENCDCFCIRCHMKLETEKGEDRAYYNWKGIQLGADRFNALKLRAHTTQKKDRKMSLLIVKALMSDLERSEPKTMGAK